LGGLCAFTFYAVVMNVAMHGWLAWYRLAVNGRETQARITRRQPENHQTCHFEYKIGSETYQGSDEGCSFEVGSIVPVTYSPTNPAFATTWSPQAELLTELLGAILMASVAGVIAAWRVIRRPLTTER
jgi:hypothetical protein